MQPDDNDLAQERAQQESAADLIRNKLSVLYGDEPDAGEEQAEIEALPPRTLSKHQLYMKSLGDSGRSLEEIQTAWHDYYTDLSDAGKHEVWQEFYSEHQRAKDAGKRKQELEKRRAEKKKSEPAKSIIIPANDPIKDEQDAVAAKRAAQNIAVPVSNNTAALKKKKKAKGKYKPDLRTANDVRAQLLAQIQGRAEVRKNPHVRSLAFGLTMGFLTIFFLLFSFFNERFITPFIRPSGNVSATPIIVDPDASGPIGPEPKIIIPKINVEAPVVYDVPTIEEKDVQKGLEKGVVHYATTPNPGEKGNAVIFGHSSSNILNKGKYKFAFILLKSLEKDDTFIIQKDGKRYVYKVYNKFVTSPTDTSVLGPTDKAASLTLITCDPPGTSTNRLIVQAEQIFPDPGANAASSVQANGAPAVQPKQLAGNSESLWHRLTSWL
jgi:LPXTG-site transpeptidase (sortase) family protein